MFKVWSEFFGDFVLGANGNLRIENFLRNFAPWHVVHILHVAAQIATLGKRFQAFWTLEWSLARMLPEVISEVAAFLEDTIASLVLAFEEQLNALG